MVQLIRLHSRSGGIRNSWWLTNLYFQILNKKLKKSKKKKKKNKKNKRYRNLSRRVRNLNLRLQHQLPLWWLCKRLKRLWRKEWLRKRRRQLTQRRTLLLPNAINVNSMLMLLHPKNLEMFRRFMLVSIRQGRFMPLSHVAYVIDNYYIDSALLYKNSSLRKIISNLISNGNVENSKMLSSWQQRRLISIHGLMIMSKDILTSAGNQFLMVLWCLELS